MDPVTLPLVNPPAGGEDISRNLGRGEIEGEQLFGITTTPEEIKLVEEGLMDFFAIATPAVPKASADDSNKDGVTTSERGEQQGENTVDAVDGTGDKTYHDFIMINENCLTWVAESVEVTTSENTIPEGQTRTDLNPIPTEIKLNPQSCDQPFPILQLLSPEEEYRLLIRNYNLLENKNLKLNKELALARLQVEQAQQEIAAKDLQLCSAFGILVEHPKLLSRANTMECELKEALSRAETAEQELKRVNETFSREKKKWMSIARSFESLKVTVAAVTEEFAEFMKDLRSKLTRHRHLQWNRCWKLAETVELLKKMENEIPSTCTKQQVETQTEISLQEVIPNVPSDLLGNEEPGTAASDLLGNKEPMTSVSDLLGNKEPGTAASALLANEETVTSVSVKNFTTSSSQENEVNNVSSHDDIITTSPVAPIPVPSPEKTRDNDAPGGKEHGEDKMKRRLKKTALFYCRCGISFKNQYHLDIHLTKIKVLVSFMCFHCKQLFDTITPLQRHMKKEHKVALRMERQPGTRLKRGKTLPNNRYPTRYKKKSHTVASRTAGLDSEKISVDKGINDPVPMEMEPEDAVAAATSTGGDLEGGVMGITHPPQQPTPQQDVPEETRVTSSPLTSTPPPTNSPGIDPSAIPGTSSVQTEKRPAASPRAVTNARKAAAAVTSKKRKPRESTNSKRLQYSCPCGLRFVSRRLLQQHIQARKFICRGNPDSDIGDVTPLHQ